MNLSIVVPLYNEDESLTELCDWIVRVVNANNYSYEIILVDDGSKDKSWSVIEKLSAGNKNIKGIKFRRNYGKSAALQVGFEATQGDVVITMDADMQDSPDEIPGLYKMIVDDHFDLVSGWKKKRHDPLMKTIPSKFFNWTTRKMSGIYTLHDFNCGLKSYRKEVVKSIEVYGEMHRYIPVIAKWNGFSKITEKVVEHRARKYGVTKFGLERFINGFLDLLSLMFVSRFGKRPMHLFGFIGCIMFFIGFLAAGYLGVTKLLSVYSNEYARLITQRPSFYISLTCMIIGSQMFLAGFLGELISRKAHDKNHYDVAARVN
ncbi:MAG: glycosyltransferase family 2 protein [Bacteroidetes bacterium]|nr:glycosyltransferase family 2 protein [Bacteroidota bacterium]